MGDPVINVGDWVRFYYDGELVIGEVEYTSIDMLGGMILNTTAGRVTAEMVLEVRTR